MSSPDRWVRHKYYRVDNLPARHPCHVPESPYNLSWGDVWQCGDEKCRDLWKARVLHPFYKHTKLRRVTDFDEMLQIVNRNKRAVDPVRLSPPLPPPPPGPASGQRRPPVGGSGECKAK